MKTILFGFLFIAQNVFTQEDSINCGLRNTPFENFGSLETDSQGHWKSGRIWSLENGNSIDSLLRDSLKFQKYALHTLEKNVCQSITYIQAGFDYDDGFLYCHLQFDSTGYYEFIWLEERGGYGITNRASSVIIYHLENANQLVIYWTIVPSVPTPGEPYSIFLIIDLEDSP